MNVVLIEPCFLERVRLGSGFMPLSCSAFAKPKLRLNVLVPSPRDVTGSDVGRETGVADRHVVLKNGKNYAVMLEWVEFV